jgi:transposase
MLYAAAAVERAMKVQEVICRVLAGTLTWLQGADILGIHTRSLRRWRARYERDGVLGLHDGRRGQPSRRKAPVAEVKRILRLYRERYGPRDGHPGFNVRHFYHLARRDHGVTLSYTFVKLALHEARPRPQGAHPGPPSAAPRAARVFRRTPAPRWQPPSLARALPGGAPDPHRYPR